MSPVFVFLCCVLFVCVLGWAIPTAWRTLRARRETLALLRRDNEVKTQLIREMQLELAMLRVSVNMQSTVAATRASHPRPYLVPNTPNLLKPQIGPTK